MSAEEFDIVVIVSSSIVSCLCLFAYFLSRARGVQQPTEPPKLTSRTKKRLDTLRMEYPTATIVVCHRCHYQFMAGRTVCHCGEMQEKPTPSKKSFQ